MRRKRARLNDHILSTGVLYDYLERSCGSITGEVTTDIAVHGGEVI